MIINVEANTLEIFSVEIGILEVHRYFFSQSAVRSMARWRWTGCVSR